MKSTIILTFMLVFGLLAFPVGSMASLNGTEVYKMKITFDSGDTIDDCYTFFPDGTLVIATITAGVWAYQNNGNSKLKYQGVVGTWGVHGLKSAFGIWGNEMEAGGTTSVVRGKRVKECELSETATNSRNR